MSYVPPGLYRSQTLTHLRSENTPQGRKKTKLNQTLLNGNNICMVGDVDVKCSVVTDVMYSVDPW